MALVNARRIPLLLQLFLFLAAIGTEIAIQAQSKDVQSAEDEFTIKVDENLVATDVTVIGDNKGELRAEDFILYDNNGSQKVTHFSQNELPLAIAILIDSSASIGKIWPILRLAAISSLRKLNPIDQVALFSFAGGYKVLCELTKDRRFVAKEIAKPLIGNGSDIYGTIFNAADYLKKNAPRQRRAMILISDNCHNTLKGHSAAEDKYALLDGAITLYDLKINSFDSQLPFCREPNELIKRMTEETGGEVLNIGNPEALKDVLGKAVSRLREQYTLGFSPASLGSKRSFHRLSVKLADNKRCPSCKVITRSGYYAGTSAPELSPLPISQSAEQTLKNDDALVEEMLIAAATATGYANSIQFATSTSEEVDQNGRRQVKLDVNVPANNVRFETRDNQHSCRLSIGLFFADKANNIRSAGGKKLRLMLNDEEYARAAKSGIPYSFSVAWDPSYAYIRVVAYDELGDKLGDKLIEFQNTNK